VIEFGTMYGQNSTASVAKAARKNGTVMVKWPRIAPPPHAGEDADHRHDAEQRERRAPGTAAKLADVEFHHGAP
jgi:hypothetical protein